ncbi:MAG: PKD domain-containing protein, partial [Halobacteriales archaeon]|nr:PKD domain-containing protein [Halobacteriales archaeon]
MPSPTTDGPRTPQGRRVATVVLAAAALLALSLTPAGVAADLGTAAVDGTTAALQTNEPPTATFTHSPTNPEPGQAVRLNASASSDPDGEIVTYRWDIDGDGQSDIEGGPNQRLSFPRAGTYTVGLTVEDDAGATDTTTREIVVSGDQPPVANLEISKTEVVVGETTTLAGTGSSDPDGQIVSMEFDTDGDGTFDRTFDAPTDLRFEYAEPGTYQVTLRVTDNDGFTDTATGQVVVESASPTATDAPTTPATQSPTVGAGAPPAGASGDGLGTRLGRLAT